MASPPTPSRVRFLDAQVSPESVMAAWPADKPLVTLWSGQAADADLCAARARWCVLAQPRRFLTAWTPQQARGLIQELGWQVGRGGNPNPRSPDVDQPPFQGGWIGWLSYDLGPVLEPACRLEGVTRPERGWPLMHWALCPDALIYDRLLGAWHACGVPDIGPLARAAQAATRTASAPRYRMSALASDSADARAQFVHSVERALEYIRAGDMYQANLAHRLCANFDGSARSLFMSLMERSQAWYAGYIEGPPMDGRPSHALATASPELFIEYAPDENGAPSRLVTRPMKGTRRWSEGDEGVVRELHDSVKDRAELDMITDLLRNDLGRVCELGSVRVDERRVIERHASPGTGGVVHATSEVSGLPRSGLTLLELLTAIFPSGSITGCPKVRAMQVIDELEPVRRGPYCGSFGYISFSGHMALNVCIRTACILGAKGDGGQPGEFKGGTLDYSVGAGIVADSNPGEEWDETLVKAGVMGGLSREKST